MTRTLTVLLASVLGIGCGDDDATPDSGPPMDGGVDTAVDMDAGADAEPGFDAGPVEYPTCNPLLGADACPTDERCGLISDEGEVSFVCRFDGVCARRR